MYTFKVEADHQLACLVVYIKNCLQESATDGDEVLSRTYPSDLLKGTTTTLVDTVLKSSQRSGRPGAAIRRPSVGKDPILEDHSSLGKNPGWLRLSMDDSFHWSIRHDEADNSIHQ